MKYFFLISFTCSLLYAQAQNKQYPWLTTSYDASQTIGYRISPPPTYSRTSVKENSFADWLRHLPLLAKGSEVRLYDGSLKGSQRVHEAVINIDTGNRDLQQCADAVMRLKAEYHYACGEYDKIHFNYTSGDRIDFTKWQSGYKPRVSGNNVNWVKSSSANGSYTSFRSYMNSIYMYAGTYSLDRELIKVENVDEIQVGDVFIQGGFPGHAVIVLDMATHNETGEKIFLLGQSYMPAQDMHVLKNFQDSELSPWYKIPSGELQTPEWWFKAGSLKRFE